MINPIAVFRALQIRVTISCLEERDASDSCVLFQLQSRHIGQKQCVRGAVWDGVAQCEVATSLRHVFVLFLVLSVG